MIYRILFSPLVHCSVGHSEADAVFRKLDVVSVKSAALSDEINTIVKDALVKFHELARSNSKLSADNINRSQSFLQKIEGATKDEVMKQNRIMVQDLGNALKELDAAEERHLADRQSFSDNSSKNSVKLDRLGAELHGIDKEVDRTLSNLILDATKSRRCVLGFCVDTKKTRQIRALIQKLADKRTTVEAEFGQASENSSLKQRSTRDMFVDEHYRIGSLRGAVKSCLDTIADSVEEDSVEPELIDIIKGQAKMLIAECRKYINQHKF